MPRTRPPRNAPDPRHRYFAIDQGTRVAASAYEHALAHLLHGTDLDAAVTPEVLAATTAALHSYDVVNVRRLFDAALLGGGTPEELLKYFRVPENEYTAYAHLFFDRSVFPNAFHTMAWISTVVDVPTKELYREAYTQGFRAMRFKFAPDGTGADVDDALSLMMQADARAYYDARVPLGDRRGKDLRVLGKQVLSTATTLAKVAKAAPDEESSSNAPEFVVQSRPANPTLQDLLDRGIVILT